ncbi:helix-turn-helix domain-containing protein [Streptomyces hygroscopicus]|uniref:helix-turn-helix domain-containing protein n=1 Tax=Streptomyces hygroscopicus TaxID=1912 RepID=UPI00369DFD0A
MPSQSETTAQRFGRVVKDAARDAGYDLDSPRGGGRTQLARDTGMSESSVGRMLDGKTLPQPQLYEAIARAVKLPVGLLLVEAGILSRETLTETTRTRVASPITPEEAAQELGITDPSDRALFLGMVERLRTDRPTGHNRPNDPEAGGEAAQA